jgi:peptidoglycan hydrolase-like protein with peptidoglycan-binding domain/subtilisin family serine protease
MMSSQNFFLVTISKRKVLIFFLLCGLIPSALFKSSYSQPESIEFPSLEEEFGEPGTPVPNAFIVTLEDPLVPIVDVPSTSVLANVSSLSANGSGIDTSVAYLEMNNVNVTEVYDDGFAVTIPYNVDQPSALGLDNTTRPATLNDIGEIFAPNSTSAAATSLVMANISLPETVSMGASEDLVCSVIESNENISACEQIVKGGISSQTTPTGIVRIGGPILMEENSNKNVTIAIMDSGVTDHPELNLIGKVTFIGDPNDNINHGTHVSGTAGAKDNSVGVIGVAPGAKIYSIKVLDNKAPNSPGGTDTFKKGLEFVRNNADSIDVLNLSITLGRPSKILNELVKEIVDRGVVVVGAAGNKHVDATSAWPGSDPNIIIVGAISDNDSECGSLGGIMPVIVNNRPAGQIVDVDDSFAVYSNLGSAVDIVAPGTNINSTSNDGSYMVTTGTSMASPHVAGAAALIVESNPSASPNEVRSILNGKGIAQVTQCEGGHKGGYTVGPNESTMALLNAQMESPEFTPVLTAGSSGAQVNMLQGILSILGYNPGPIDGIFGPKTNSAVIKFQQDHGLTEDGIVGLNTWNTMCSPLASKADVLKSGSSGFQTELVQRILFSLGYNPGPIDGIFGPKTNSAVIKFQQDHGLTEDGIVGLNTWNSLCTSLGSSIVEPAQPGSIAVSEAASSDLMTNFENLHTTLSDLAKQLGIIIPLLSVSNSTEIS